MKHITFGNTDIDIIGYHGFVYKVTEIATGKFYIGLKHFKAKRLGKKVESDWATYRTSSEYLKDDIAENPLEYSYEIVCLCKDEPSLKYAEARYMMLYDCLTSELSFNNNIMINLRCKLKDYDNRVKEL